MEQLNILLVTTATLAFTHTLIGVDHYLPFIVLSRANNWSTKKTMLTAALCGAGHVLSSVVLGFAGIALSAGLSSLVNIEDARGKIAAYFLIAFGLIYTVYGIRRAVKNKPHKHIMPDGNAVLHMHSDSGEHTHDKYEAKNPGNVLWWLFVLFVLGPCEPLIPLIMYPAATQNALALVSLTVCFAICTIAAMLLMVFLGIKGIRLLKINAFEKYSHALAGFAILVCGISVTVLPI